MEMKMHDTLEYTAAFLKIKLDTHNTASNVTPEYLPKGMKKFIDNVLNADADVSFIHSVRALGAARMTVSWGADRQMWSLQVKRGSACCRRVKERGFT